MTMDELRDRLAELCDRGPEMGWAPFVRAVKDANAAALDITDTERPGAAECLLRMQFVADVAAYWHTQRHRARDTAAADAAFIADWQEHLADEETERRRHYARRRRALAGGGA